MLPVVALVGRPNVGKSTLFNKLTNTRNALVADFPGLTRDRQYGDAAYEQKKFIVIDTGGIGVDNEQVDALMIKQSELAIAEADVILFIVDARAGLMPLDIEIANKLRKLSKTSYLVVNKIDGLDFETVGAEFYKLGMQNIAPISASHGLGVGELLSDLTKDFTLFNDDEIINPSTTIRLACVGRPNVGKSTLINRMLGEERTVVCDLPGTTRDSIEIPFTREGQDYIFVDTAGVRRRGHISELIEKFSVIKTLKAIADANVCLMVLDASEGLTVQDMHLLGFIIDSGKALVIVINKWDGLDLSHKEHVKTELLRRLSFADFAKVRFISALHGSGVGILFKDVVQAYKAATKKITTGIVTRVLEKLISAHQPPLVKNRRVKPRYAHAGGHNPPLIVIHGNQVEALPTSYRRYLIKGFIAELKLIGTPLKVSFKNNDNPFEGKKNKLTPKQVASRKRLMQHVKKK